LTAEESDEEETLDRRRSAEPGEQPSAQDLKAAEALAFDRKPPGRLADIRLSSPTAMMK
jgi:hypothetical protein